MLQPSRSIMPGWVWANAQAGGARIDTGKVWTLTERPVGVAELVPPRPDGEATPGRE